MGKNETKLTAEEKSFREKEDALFDKLKAPPKSLKKLWISLAMRRSQNHLQLNVPEKRVSGVKLIKRSHLHSRGRLFQDEFMNVRLPHTVVT